MCLLVDLVADVKESKVPKVVTTFENDGVIFASGADLTFDQGPSRLTSYVLGAAKAVPLKKPVSLEIKVVAPIFPVRLGKPTNCGAFNMPLV